MIINKKQIAINRTPMTRTAKDIFYIVIHDTGNKSAGANAEMHYRYFNSGNKNASADFFVDDKQILQINDWTKYYSWAVGDGRGIYGITNRNSISIEMCINSDSIFDITYKKTIELTKHLMNVLNLPADRVVRHYDASRKICPATMQQNNWTMWWRFKTQLLSKSNIQVKEKEIVLMQRSLYELGYKITIDGISGPQTKGFLADFQRTIGIIDDGNYGPITKQKLTEIMSNERMVIIYCSVNILSQTKKQGEEPLIFDRKLWIKKATNDIDVYWLLRKIANYFQ